LGVGCGIGVVLGKGMSSTMSQIVLLTAKDLRIEARTRQTLGLVVVLGILIVTVLGLGLGSQHTAGALGAPAVLWVAYLFAGVLCFEKTMALERQDGALAGLLLAPIDRGVIFAGKLASNLVLMLLVACAVTPVGVLFFGFDLSPAPGGFAVVMGLGMLGFAAVGTLFAALVSSTRLQGGMLAMVVFPIILPLVIVSTRLLSEMFRDGRGLEFSSLGLLVAFDVVFLVASWLLFELILEP
jgi:heme exporter protein B